MGGAEARTVGEYSLDRYNKDSKKLTEGVSGFVPFVGPLQGALDQLVDGIKNGFIYAGVRSTAEAFKIKVGQITGAGVSEAHPHDLMRN
jgi:IMP dehydrogenase